MRRGRGVWRKRHSGILGFKLSPICLVDGVLRELRVRERQARRQNDGLLEAVLPPLPLRHSITCQARAN